ncbi:MAG: cell division initiation protein, partial [Acidimicrobiales bacterium]
VQRTEIVREAQHAANRIVDDARADARRLRHEAEDFCDQRLANFEIVLERLSRTVHGGREKLRGSPPSEDGAGPGSPEGAGLSESAVEDAFFDQDR